MLSLRRPLAVAALLFCLDAASAAAQTVIVTKAPPQDKIEVFVAGQPAGSGTVDSSGIATIPITLKPATQLDARVYDDVCPGLHRIHIVEKSGAPPARPDGCERREIVGIFWVRPVNTLVIDVGGPIPTLLLVRGKYNPLDPAPVRRAANGLVIFGGGGLQWFSEISRAACGTVTDCRQDHSAGAFTAGAAFWIRPWLAAEGSYIRPSKLNTAGGGADFDFTDTFDVHLFTALANVGIPVGGARIYGKVGANFHRAKIITTQTQGEDTQTNTLETEGWGPIYGGGFEGWIKPRFAVYIEAAFGKLKGSPTLSRVEGDLDEGFTYVFGGVRVKLF